MEKDYVLPALLLAFQPTEEVGWSQQWTSLDVTQSLINLEAIRDVFVQLFVPLTGALLMDKCMWLSLAAVVSSVSSGLWRRRLS